MKKKLSITPKILHSVSKIIDNGTFTPTKDEYDIRDNKNAGEAKKKSEEHPTVPFLQLYQYASCLDKFLLSIALIFSTIAGICNVVLCLTFGDATGAIVDYVYASANNTTTQNVLDEILVNDMRDFVLVTCSAGLGILISTYFSTVLFNYSALRQAFKIRELFLAKILDQDVSWYDVHQTGDFASRVADDLKKVEEGMGEKVSIFIFYAITCIASILQGLIKGWKLALVCMISFPITSACMGTVGWISSKLAKQEMEAYGAAGAIAEETLSSIRTVVAFGGQAKEEERYSKHLLTAKNNNIKRAVFNGLSQALMWFFTFCSYSLAFWYGSTLILAERQLPKEEIVYDAANMITVFYCVLIGTLYFGMASPFIEIFGTAKAAASKIFNLIATKPKINASKGNGSLIEKLEGNIVFKDVDFNYPSRPDVTVLRGFNLTIKSGETVALVGTSGCGKSTCIQLIQRFYDPIKGSVCIDGTNIADLDLAWLRGCIGVVGQEPVLFETTIAENIRYGCKLATQDDIVKATKKANAHTFISALPQGYDTMVGERGAQLSVGQKQRIAIARALVRKPAILLLDEATSALDTKSEAVVQAALDAASEECTTIIVAHRLSTIRKADRIVVISGGKVQEEGSHNELMSAKGGYYELVQAQVSAPENKEDPMFSEVLSIAAEKLVSKSTTDRKASIAEETSTQKEEDGAIESSSLWTVMKINSAEWWIIAIGCVSSVVQGAAMPIYGVVFGDVIGVLAGEDPVYVQEEANKFSLYFLILGIVVGIASFLQIYTFGIAGEKLTMRLRKRMFKAMLNQEMGWFDEKNNGVGALCANLSGEAASVQGATGQRIGTILNTIATVLVALGTALIFEWRIASVALCFTPILVFSIYLEQRMMAKESEVQYITLQKSTKIAVEAINGIRTIASLGCEATFHELYMKELTPYQKIAKRNTHVRGLVFGISRSTILFLFSASLYYGAMLVKDEGIDYARVFIVSQVLVTSSWSLGNALAFTPNFQKGLIAATRIFGILNRVPQIQNGSSDVNEKWGAGNIDYQKVHFSYPTRPSVEVLKDLNLSILQGKMVALVGPSGCGKSTIIQLLERFYDPTQGEVTKNGKGIEKMHLSALRSHLGIVSQEPNLFSKTIAENIAYGDNSRMITHSEIVSAAKKANIHNFIVSLPLGYETKLGEKGTQLSGGQKQRVAIARALVRNPKVLLLDEATSALDAESEKAVQEALDKAKVGRTCISIAHRLTTIQDADVICVINHGRVAEMGSHSELLSAKGLYYNLHSLQNGSK